VTSKTLCTLHGAWKRMLCPCHRLCNIKCKTNWDLPAKCVWYKTIMDSL